MPYVCFQCVSQCILCMLYQYGKVYLGVKHRSMYLDLGEEGQVHLRDVCATHRHTLTTSYTPGTSLSCINTPRP